MNTEPLVLPRNCGNCQHFDGDSHCALPRRLGAVLIHRVIDRSRVVCVKHEPKREDEE